MGFSVSPEISSHGRTNFPKASLIENTFWKQFAVGYEAEVLAVKQCGLNCHPIIVGEREGIMQTNRTRV